MDSFEYIILADSQILIQDREDEPQQSLHKLQQINKCYFNISVQELNGNIGYCYTGTYFYFSLFLHLFESLTAEREQVQKIHIMSFCYINSYCEFFRLVAFLQLAIHLLFEGRFL
jgi:hypothetical protein